MARGVFCDYLGVTVANDDWPGVRMAIEPALDAIGARVELDGDRGTLWRAGDGTVKAQRYGPVTSIGASGAVLAGLRAVKAFGAYLAGLGSVNHRVTRLDAAYDVKLPTAPIIASIVEKAHSLEGLALTRKRVLSKHVTRLVTRGADGADTGTCYVGSRSAEVRACVYDKRQERLDRGLIDVGPLTRYELRVKSGVGATLRDAHDPTELFWHFMAPGVLGRPAGVADWEPRGEGFEVDWPDQPTAAARLVKRVGASADVQALLRLADQAGPYGFELLVGELRKLHQTRVWAQPTETASNASCPPPVGNSAGGVRPAAASSLRAC